jgi:hypothetical protein
VLAVVALAASFTLPALATPGGSGPATLASARAEAARLEQAVGRLDLEVETLAEATRPPRPASTGSSRPPAATRRPWSGQS